MEFRHPVAASEKNTESCNYLTQNLNDIEAGQAQFNELLEKLGNTIDMYPEWHPILTAPAQSTDFRETDLYSLESYDGIDHTVQFVRGFVTCPYSEDKANQLVNAVSCISGLHAYRLQNPLYSDNAYPVVIEALEIILEADGTIRSRDALIWFTQKMVKHAPNAQVAETWWNMRADILGCPHGSRSSLLVNQHTGSHMRKILEALNNSGIYGPVKETSLEMLSKKKRKSISETLVRASIDNWSNTSDKFEFELRGENCKAEVSDTWNDGHELSIRVMIGDFDLYTSGFYYPEKKILETSDPKGKRNLAEKFL